jgi:hypothetical protein
VVNVVDFKPLALTDLNPARNFGFFYVLNLSSLITECPWFYSDTRSCLKQCMEGCQMSLIHQYNLKVAIYCVVVVKNPTHTR